MRYESLEIAPKMSAFEPTKTVTKNPNARCYHFFDSRQQDKRMHPGRIPVQGKVLNTNTKPGPLLPWHFTKAHKNILSELQPLGSSDTKSCKLSFCNSPDTSQVASKKGSLKLDSPTSITASSIFSPCRGDKVNIHAKSPYSPIGFDRR